MVRFPTSHSGRVPLQALLCRLVVDLPAGHQAEAGKVRNRGFRSEAEKTEVSPEDQEVECCRSTLVGIQQVRVIPNPWRVLYALLPFCLRRPFSGFVWPVNWPLVSEVQVGCGHASPWEPASIAEVGCGWSF